MIAEAAVALALLTPAAEKPQPCQTQACHRRVERRHMRHVIRPYRDWLRRLAWCESRGNPRASNGTHFGLYQFALPTWRAVGGPGHPLNASRLQQSYRAVILLKRVGPGQWECKA